MDTINELPIEILTKIIKNYGVTQTTQLVCKLWDIVARDIVDKAFKQHKKRFAATVAEINSIVYHYRDCKYSPTIIYGYRIKKETYFNKYIKSIPVISVFEDDDYYQIKVYAVAKKSVSIRQYKNKASKYICRDCQPTEFPVQGDLDGTKHWVHKFAMFIGTYYYENTDNIDSNYRIDIADIDKLMRKQKIQPNGPYYQRYIDDIDLYESTEFDESDDSETELDDSDEPIEKIKHCSIFNDNYNDIQYSIHMSLVNIKLVDPKYFK
ncbi:hypothetical protein PV-S19_0395 [Pacmanvirus S19]|nr:hypothetical protein PV-S19_0395 [Pacmanvirus S19]